MSGQHGFRSAFAAELDAYLTFKQNMGFVGASRVWYLKRFDFYCDANDLTVFDQETVEGWVIVQLGGERADETVPAAHGRAPTGTGSTHSSRRSRSTLKYRLVDSGLAWPSTAEIVGSGTAAASSRVAAL